MMDSIIVPLILGLFLIYLGIQNMKGNISSLHSYHRKRVKEEDIIPFGKKAGVGTIIIGSSLILATCFQYAAEKLNNPVLQTVQIIVLVIGFVVGSIFLFYAMIKYNKGIF